MRDRTGSYVTLVAIALALTLASVAVQRVGPLRSVEGEGFCPGMEPCRIPVLGGGLPMPWLVDNPQISVPNQLSPFEDHFRGLAFAVDFVLWLAALEIALRLWRRYRVERP